MLTAAGHFNAEIYSYITYECVCVCVDSIAALIIYELTYQQTFQVYGRPGVSDHVLQLLQPGFHPPLGAQRHDRSVVSFPKLNLKRVSYNNVCEEEKKKKKKKVFRPPDKLCLYDM